MVVNTSNPDRSADSLVRPAMPNFGLGRVNDSSIFFVQLASSADKFPAWGTAPYRRDVLMRAFWPTAPLFPGALFSTIAKYTAFGYSLQGPARTVKAIQEMLASCNLGRGWNHWLTQVLTDVMTQDNGSFSEILRAYDSETAPILCLNHLDASRCARTGIPETPIYYTDIYGSMHLLKWYQVLEFTDMPSPIEAARGMQYCALSRCLTAAQILRDMATYRHEKISGRYNRAIHLVGGVQQRLIDVALRQDNEKLDNLGITKYAGTPVIAALDPTAAVSHVEIDMASLPDGFDLDVEMRWYVAELALAMGADYQDFAPLPGRSTGSAQQSETLHAKARVKGSARFMSEMEHAFNFQGIMPRNVLFKYGQQDIDQDGSLEAIKLQRATERATRIASGELTAQMAAREAVDFGDLSVTAYQAMFGTLDRTDNVIVPDDTPVNSMDT